MKISFFDYNAFLIESGDKKIAIDPGAQLFYRSWLSPLIPQSEWSSITHIFITHGDPDHYWYVDKVAMESGAPVICNRSMVKEVGDRQLMLGPRNKGLAFTTELKKIHLISVDESIEVDGLQITGIKATHGELCMKLGPFSKSIKPGPNERIGWGAIGFDIGLNGKRIVNLGDTLLEKKSWQTIHEPDLLMLPIGGKAARNTMDEQAALEVVEQMQPRWVIPCHYDCPFLFFRNYNPADAEWFREEVEKMGSRCLRIKPGGSVFLNEE